MVAGKLTPLTWAQLHQAITKQYRETFSQLAYDGIGGDPTGPAGRDTKFPVGVSFGAMEVDSSKQANNEEYALAVQMDATFGKPATMDDYTQLIQSGKKLYGTAASKPDTKINRPPGARSPKAPASGGADKGGGDKPEVRTSKSKWKCGQLVNGKPCAFWNFHYATGDFTDTTAYARMHAGVGAR